MLENDSMRLHNVLASRFLLRNLCFPLYFSFLVLITRRKLSVISKDDLMWNTLVFVLLVYGPFQPYNSSSESVGYSIPIRAPWSQGKFINGSGFFASKLGGFKTELVVPCQGESKLQRGPQKLPLSPSPSFSPSPYPWSLWPMNKRGTDKTSWAQRDEVCKVSQCLFLWTNPGMLFETAPRYRKIEIWYWKPGAQEVGDLSQNKISFSSRWLGDERRYPGVSGIEGLPGQWNTESCQYERANILLVKWKEQGHSSAELCFQTIAADRDLGWTQKVELRKDKCESLCEALEEVNYLPLDK